MIYPQDNPEIIGKKITDFLEKCKNKDILVSKIVFEVDKPVIAELIV